MKYDWDKTLKDVEEAIKEGCPPKYRELSKYLKIPKSTLNDALRRMNTTPKSIAKRLGVEYEEGNGGIKETEHDQQKSETIEKDLNHRVTAVKGKDITTLEELKALANVDDEIWRVTRWLTNKWSVAIKNKQSGGFTKVPLYQVKAWLERRNLIPVSPPVSPIEIKLSGNGKNKTWWSDNDSVEEALIVPDAQIGFKKSIEDNSLHSFHDRLALDIALKVAQSQKFKKVVFLGDWIDLPEFTDHFVRSPEFYFTTQPAIVEAAWWISQFRMAQPEAELYFIPGNHEKRLQDMVIKHMLYAYDLKPADKVKQEYPDMSIQRLLSLDSLGIIYEDEYPHGETWINPAVRVVHGNLARARSLSTATALIKNSTSTVIQGHTHRVELASKVIRYQDSVRVIYGFTSGCLCKTDGSVPGSNADQQWQQAISKISYDPDSDFHGAPVATPINHGLAIYDGVYIEAEDRTEQIEDETKFKLS